MSAAWCEKCDQPGDYRLVRIIGTGGYGQRIETVLCSTHAAPIIRDSTQRFEIHPIERRQAPPPPNGEQPTLLADLR